MSLRPNLRRNAATLASFVDYCKKHPDQRFWQALRNWSGYTLIYATNEHPPPERAKDTFYWEGRRDPLPPNREPPPPDDVGGVTKR